MTEESYPVFAFPSGHAEPFRTLSFAYDCADFEEEGELGPPGPRVLLADGNGLVYLDTGEVTGFEYKRMLGGILRILRGDHLPMVVLHVVDVRGAGTAIAKIT